MEFIQEKYWWQNKELKVLDQDNKKDIKALLLGHKITKVAEDQILLDDGTLVKIVPNEGGCSCASGDYSLTDLNEVDNIITAVDVVEEAIPDDEWDGLTGYRVYVIAEDKKIRLFSVEGTDGSGYYGTGYELFIREPSI